MGVSIIVRGLYYSVWGYISMCVWEGGSISVSVFGLIIITTANYFISLDVGIKIS